MLQIELLVEEARRKEAAMRMAAARHARQGQAPVRVRVGGMLIRLGRLVAGDARRSPVWQG